MPEALIRKRGGAKRWRTIKLPGDKYMHVAVVGKKGPRGGKTIAGEVHKKKKSKRKGRSLGGMMMQSVSMRKMK